jgi:hypothetical protein
MFILGGLFYKFLVILLNIRLLFWTSLNFIIANLIIKLPKQFPRTFLGSSIILMLIMIYNIIYLTRKVLYKGNAYDISMHMIILYIITLILVYSIVYYALYNYDHQSFTHQNNILDNEKEDVYFNILYFTIGTNFMGGMSDIVPRTRLARTIVITHFLATVSILLIVIHKL